MASNMAFCARRLTFRLPIQRWPLIPQTTVRPFSLAIADAGSATVKSYTKTIEPSNAISNWLFGCSGLVFGMVVLGGITRLTKSGLSMVDWKVQGSFPPLSAEAWEAEFNKYKQFPEYQKVHNWMNVEDFKSIYYMEWGHRMLGRAIGVAFALPFAYFGLRGAISRPLGMKLTALLAAGGAQGLIGWWMVKSGLTEQPADFGVPRVSPYRLATHLTSGFAIFAALLHTAIGERVGTVRYLAPRRYRSLAIAATHLVAITAVSGAFVAGNHAGLIYNEFPFMGEGIVPDDIFSPFLVSTPWRNCFENPSLVQFEHRILAMASFATVCGLFIMTKRTPTLHPSTVKAASMMMGAVATQAGLGIATLLTYVPVELGALHQIGALTVVGSSVYLLRTIRIK